MKNVTLGKKLIATAACTGLALSLLSGCNKKTAAPEEDPKAVATEVLKKSFQGNPEAKSAPVLGFDELTEAISKGNYQIDIDLSFVKSDLTELEMLEGSKLSFSNQLGKDAKPENIFLSLEYQHKPFLEAQMYVDEQDVLIALPEMTNRVFALNYSEDLEGQINSSPFLGQYMQAYAGEELDEIFALLESEDSLMDAAASNPNTELLEKWNAYRQEATIFDNLMKDITVKKGEAKAYPVNGADVTCQGYQVTIPNEAAGVFLEETWNYLEEELMTLAELGNTYQQSAGMVTSLPSDAELDEMIAYFKTGIKDVTLEIYLNNEKQLVACESKFSFVDDEDKINFDLSWQFKGGNHLAENYDFNLKADVPDDASFTMTMSNANVKEKATFGLTFDFVEIDAPDSAMKVEFICDYQKASGDYQINGELIADGSVIKADASGKVSNLTVGKEMEISIDRFLLTADDLQIELAGNYSAKPYTAEITAPQGERFDLLATSEADWQMLIMEMQEEIMELIEIFN